MKILIDQRKNIQWKRFLRVVVGLILFCVSYYSVVVTLWSPLSLSVLDAINSVVFILIGSIIAVVSLSLLSIDLRHYRLGNIELLSVILLLLIVSTIYFFSEFSSVSFFKLLAIIVFHTAIHIFVRKKIHYLTSRYETSSWGIAQHGIIMFGLFIGLVLTLFLSLEIAQAPLECDTIHAGSQRIFNWSQRPVDDFMGGLMGSESSSGGLFSLFTESEFVDQVQSDQEVVRQTVCDFLVSIVQQTSTGGIAITPVGIILFLLLSPVLTILFRLVHVIVWLLLLVLQFSGVYSWKKRMRRVRELE